MDSDGAGSYSASKTLMKSSTDAWCKNGKIYLVSSCHGLATCGLHETHGPCSLAARSRLMWGTPAQLLRLPGLRI